MIDFIQKNIDEDHKWNPNDTIKLFSKQLLREQLIIRMPELQKVFDDKDFMRKYRAELQELCTQQEQQVATLLQQANSIFQREAEEKWSRHILSAFKKTPPRKNGAVNFYFIADLYILMYSLALLPQLLSHSIALTTRVCQ